MAVTYEKPAAPEPKVRVKREPVDVRMLCRLRAEDVAALLRISITTLYDGIGTGLYPAADGKDGRVTWWYSETIRPLVEKPKGA